MQQGSLVPRDKMLLCKFSTKQYCYNSYIQLYAIQAVRLKRHKGGGTTWDGWDQFLYFEDLQCGKVKSTTWLKYKLRATVGSQ